MNAKERYRLARNMVLGAGAYIAAREIAAQIDYPALALATLRIVIGYDQRLKDGTLGKVNFRLPGPPRLLEVLSDAIAVPDSGWEDVKHNWIQNPEKVFIVSERQLVLDPILILQRSQEAPTGFSFGRNSRSCDLVYRIVGKEELLVPSRYRTGRYDTRPGMS